MSGTYLTPFIHPADGEPPGTWGDRDPQASFCQAKRSADFDPHGLLMAPPDDPPVWLCPPTWPCSFLTMEGTCCVPDRFKHCGGLLEVLAPWLLGPVDLIHKRIQTNQPQGVSPGFLACSASKEPRLTPYG